MGEVITLGEIDKRGASANAKTGAITFKVAIDNVPSDAWEGDFRKAGPRFEFGPNRTSLLVTCNGPTEIESALAKVRSGLEVANAAAAARSQKFEEKKSAEEQERATLLKRKHELEAEANAILEKLK